MQTFGVRVVVFLRKSKSGTLDWPGHVTLLSTCMVGGAKPTSRAVVLAGNCAANSP